MGRLLLLVYGAVGAYAYFFADRQLFLPPPPSYGPSAEILRIPLVTGEPEGETVTGSVPAPTLAALYLPNPAATHTLLYSHGNAEDLGDLQPFFGQLHRAGFAILAYDYRGYGLSPGKPSEQNTYEDIEAAYRYLTETQGVPPDKILIQGRSLGGGPATYLATRYPVGGLILESTFRSVFTVVTRVPLFPFDKYPNRDRLRTLNVPLLVIHGTQDEVIPFRHGQQLYAAAPGPKQAYWVTGAGHNNLVTVAGNHYFTQLQTFARSLTQPQDSTPSSP